MDSIYIYGPDNFLLGPEKFDDADVNLVLNISIF